MSITLNLKRENTLKVPLNDVEQSELRKFCKGRVAPFVRDLLFAHINNEANRIAERRQSEWPRNGQFHGHVQRFPNRASLGRTGMRKNL
jgi:hypothetical protein